MDRRMFAVPILALFLLGAFIFTNKEEQTPNPVIDYGKVHGEVCVAVNGNSLGCYENTVSNTFLNDTRDCMAQGAYCIYNHIALGNTSAPTATSTSHPGLISECGLTSADGTYKTEQVSAGNWTIYHTWTSTCTIVVNTTGIYNDTSSGHYGGGTTITSASLTNGDTIQVNYTRWVA